MATIEQLQAEEIDELKQKLKETRAKLHNAQTTIKRQSIANKTVKGKPNTKLKDDLVLMKQLLLQLKEMTIEVNPENYDEIVDYLHVFMSQKSEMNDKVSETNISEIALIVARLVGYINKLYTYKIENYRHVQEKDNINLRYMFLCELTHDFISYATLSELQKPTKEELYTFYDNYIKEHEERLKWAKYAIMGHDELLFHKSLYRDYEIQAREVFIERADIADLENLEVILEDFEDNR